MKEEKKSNVQYDIGSDICKVLMSGCNEKYHKMYSGETSKPISSKEGDILSYQHYEAKRDKYHDRLQAEKENFNRAVCSIRDTHEQNVLARQKRKAIIKKTICIILSILAIFCVLISWALGAFSIATIMPTAVRSAYVTLFVENLLSDEWIAIINNIVLDISNTVVSDGALTADECAILIHFAVFCLCFVLNVLCFLIGIVASIVFKIRHKKRTKLLRFFVSSIFIFVLITGVAVAVVNIFETQIVNLIQ